VQRITATVNLACTSHPDGYTAGAGEAPGVCGRRCLMRVEEVGFAQDSPLEEAGFEPSFPRDRADGFQWTLRSRDSNPRSP
jgi:hypothetical protein